MFCFLHVLYEGVDSHNINLTHTRCLSWLVEGLYPLIADSLLHRTSWGTLTHTCTHTSAPPKKKKKKTNKQKMYMKL